MPANLDRYMQIFNEMKKGNLPSVTDYEIIDSLKTLQNNLCKEKDNLAIIAAKETGKPIKYCLAEVFRSIKIIDDGITCLMTLKYDSGVICTNELNARWYRKKIPVGTVLGFTPFSSPYSSYIHKLVASIIYKNNFICKPSPKALECSIQLYNIIRNSLSIKNKQCVNILPLPNDEITMKILSHADFDCLLFTGKSSTASTIKNVIVRKRAVFETGSSAMVYVAKSSDINVAVKKIVKGAFSQSGMRCVATKNVFIQREISEDFINLLAKEIKNIKCGSELDPVTDVGPILNEDTLNGIMEYIIKLKENNYKIIFGGNLIGNNILEPTVLIDQGSSYVSIEEAYGPILCIHEVSNMYEIPQIYSKRSSLNISIYSKDINEVDDWINYCDKSGSIFVNHGPTDRIDNLPFGGMFDENEGKEGMSELMSVLTKDQIIYNCTY